MPAFCVPIFIVCGFGLVVFEGRAGTNFVLKSFGVSELAGINPAAKPIEASDGKLYGTGYSGGTSDQGVVFRVNKDGSGYQVLKHFNGANGDGARSQAPLMEANDGTLFGTTYGGGSNLGTIFKLNKDGSGYATLWNFPVTATNSAIATGATNGAYPCGGLIQGADGALYGTTLLGGASNLGSVFKLNTNGSAFAVLKSFTGADGQNPRAALLQVSNAFLFGTTCSGGVSNQGAVFTLDTNGNNFAVLKSFTRTNGDGRFPNGLLLASDGKLYGATRQGGTNDSGAVFTLDPNGNNFAVRWSFVGGTNDGSGPRCDLAEGDDGFLYGTTFAGSTNDFGIIFKLDKSGGNYALLHSFSGATADGREPMAGLVRASDGLLYGTTYNGGSNGYGTIFRTDADATNYAVRWNFSRSGGDVAYPNFVMQGSDGLLYGTTEGKAGGALGGCVFRITHDGGFTVLHNFAPGEGQFPAGLTEASDGYFYGVTESGGTSNLGTIFQLSRDGSSFTTLTNFLGANGSTPLGRLIEGSDGKLYGTTHLGGSSSVGTVFKLNKDGTGLTVLRSFLSSSDGRNPCAGLIQGSDGVLFGTTRSVVNLTGGTAFKINTNGSGYATLRTFSGGVTNGSRPYGSLIEGDDGLLYGTTAAGGSNDVGIVFRMTKAGANFTVLRTFTTNSLDGNGPWGGLVARVDGMIYGTTDAGGTNDCGTLFLVGTNGSGYATLARFVADGSAGSSPQTSLAQGTDGVFYGATPLGGELGLGGIFRAAPPPFITQIAYSNAAVLTVIGAGDYACLLQAATNPATATWETIQTNVFGTNGLAIILDAESANLPARFYRVRPTP